jgi:ABC-type cobalamin/Fe3+-siderophores transport system ATPase subunit
MINFEAVGAGYNGKEILHELTLEVTCGEVVALIGPNGSGKTTCIRAASGVIPINAGRITVEGVDLTALSPAERARRIAVVPQTRLLPGGFTVAEVVSLGRTPYLNWLGKISENDLSAIDTALKLMHLDELADRSVGDLSGGELQRLFLARVLAQEAPILLLDEPTTHLDLKYQVELLQLVKTMAHPSGEQVKSGIKPTAVLMAIHDLNLLSIIADRVALLVDGSLKMVGTPAEVLQAEVLSEAYQVPLLMTHDTSSGLSLVLPKLDR